MKKHKNYKPQVRSKTKLTVGFMKKENFVIYLDREKDDSGEYRFRGICTCGTWKSSDGATSLAKIGAEAKLHQIETNNKHQLRRHGV